MEELRNEMKIIAEKISCEDYHTAQDLVALIGELEKIAYAIY